ncbi:Serine/threonine-protein kinase/endoribonuclease IRE2, partial [Dictyocoela roeselum]
ESKNLKHLNSFSFLTQIEKNILNNNYSLKIKKCYCFFDMIHKMLKPYPLDRIDIVGVKKHPFNWNAGKIFQFFAIISDYLEGRHKSSKQLFLRLEINKNKIFTKRWCDYIHPEIVADMEGRKDKNYSNFKEDMNDNRLKEQKNDFISSESKIMTTENYGHVKSYKPYNFKTVKGLLRAIRNKGTHYQELDASISRIYGGFPKGFINYYLQRFPGLVMVVYYSAKCAAGEDIICEFY